MRYLLPLLLALVGCGDACNPYRSSDRSDRQELPCEGTSEEAAYRPSAISRAEAPQLVFDPPIVELSTETPEQKVTLFNAGKGCLRLTDASIVQQTEGELALHPGDYWFREAEFDFEDQSALSVRWTPGPAPVDGIIVVVTNDPASDGGITEIPIEARP